MKAELITAASIVIPNQQMLVNVVSRRVRQLALGHRPLVLHAPGLQAGDIALMEIIEKKLTFESTLGLKPAEAETSARVVAFPLGTAQKKKAA